MDYLESEEYRLANELADLRDRLINTPHSRVLERDDLESRFGKVMDKFCRVSEARNLARMERLRALEVEHGSASNSEADPELA